MKILKTISNLLFAAAATLIVCTTFGSCKPKTPKTPGNKEQEYKTTYRIALSDGRVFEGTSTGSSNQLFSPEGSNTESVIYVYGLDGNHKNQMAAYIILDDNNNLLPLGTESVAGGGASNLNILFENQSLSLTTVPQNSSQSVIGSHTISNLVLHPWAATPASGSHLATFRYEFSGVVLRNVLGGAEDVTANGYIQCVVD